MTDALHTLRCSGPSGLVFHDVLVDAVYTNKHLPIQSRMLWISAILWSSWQSQYLSTIDYVLRFLWMHFLLFFMTCLWSVSEPNRLISHFIVMRLSRETPSLIRGHWFELVTWHWHHNQKKHSAFLLSVRVAFSKTALIPKQKESQLWQIAARWRQESK